MFIGSIALDYVIGTLAIPMLVIAYAGAARLFRILGGVFVLTGLGMFLYSGLPLTELPLLMTSTMPLLILLLIQYTYLALTMIGVHPIATIAILGEILQPMFEIINPLSIGMVLIMGALSTATVGTYGVTVTAMNTGQNPYRITLRNMPFAILCGSVGVFIGYLLL